MKTCKVCLVDKEPDKFYIAPRNRDKLRNECIKCSNTRSNKWAQNNPEKNTASSIKWAKENPKKVYAKGLEWAKENPDKVVAARIKWVKENPEKAATANSKWKKENPDKIVAYSHHRRALKKSAPGGHYTHEECVSKFEEFGGILRLFSTQRVYQNGYHRRSCFSFS